MARNVMSADERRELHEWCRVVLEFFNKVEASPSFSGFMETTDQVFRSGSQRQVRSVVRDLREWMEALTPKDRKRLDAILQLRFGKEWKADPVGDEDAAQEIYHRGRVRNEEEYRILRSRLDVIPAGSESEREIAQINSLLAAFERTL